MQILNVITGDHAWGQSSYDNVVHIAIALLVSTQAKTNIKPILNYCMLLTNGWAVLNDNTKLFTVQVRYTSELQNRLPIPIEAYLILYHYKNCCLSVGFLQSVISR